MRVQQFVEHPARRGRSRLDSNPHVGQDHLAAVDDSQTAPLQIGERFVQPAPLEP